MPRIPKCAVVFLGDPLLSGLPESRFVYQEAYVAISARSDVRIGQGQLYIGGDTYPLRNIARTSIKQYRLLPPPTPPWAKNATILGVIGAVVSLIVLIAAGSGDDSGFMGVSFFWLLFWIVVAFIGIRRLQRPKTAPVDLTALQITTSGAPHTALWTDDRVAIEELSEQITLGINDLGVTYSTNLTTYQISDKDIVNVNAPGSVGVVQDTATGIQQG
jgi:hypothetical protein